MPHSRSQGAARAPAESPLSRRSPRDPLVVIPAANRTQLLLCALALGALSLAVYANGFTSGLVVDNKYIVGLDPRLRETGWGAIKLIFTHDYWWPSRVSGLYRPLTTLSYWFNYAVLGSETDVTSYHVVNFLIHWGNACLVLLIARRLARRFAVGVIAAALFAVHPAGTEAVTNIVGRADLLATAAVLFGGWCYLRAAATMRPARTWWLVAMGASALCGVLAKESAIAIGAFVVLYDWLWRRHLIAGATLRERAQLVFRELVRKRYVFLAPAAVAFIAERLVIAAHAGGVAHPFIDNPIAGAGWFAGVMTAWGVLGRFLLLFVFPLRLSSDYSFNQIRVYGSGSVWSTLIPWVSLGAIVLLLWISARSRRREPLLAWGAFFAFTAMLPASNLIVPIGSIMAERFLYLPSAGLCVVAAWLLVDVGERMAAWPPAAAWPRHSAEFGLAALMLLALGARTVVRNGDWRDDLTLWQSALRASPASVRAHAGFAAALLDQDQSDVTLEHAITESEAAVAIMDAAPLPVARQDPWVLLNLGGFYRSKAQRIRASHDTVRAREFLDKSLGALVRARAVDSTNALIWLGLASTSLDRRDWPAARAAAQSAARLDPHDAQAYLFDGIAAYDAGRADDAAVSIAAALMLDDRNPDVWANLALCYRSRHEAPPIVESGGVPRFDLGSAVGKALTARAADLVAQNIAVANAGDVGAWRDRVLRDYSVTIPR